MFLKRQDPYQLIVGMTGVKLGDRLVQVGCGDGGRLGAIAAKVGLSGSATVVAPDELSGARAQKGAAAAGALVDVHLAPPTGLPLENDSVDLALVDDTTGVIGSLSADDRARSCRELLRVLRAGGRVMVIGSAPRAGLGGLINRRTAGPPFALSGDANKVLQAEGFKMVRTLAEHDGFVFVEGVKPRAG
jgi:ubiquinone/menaquinone biosynthesis C-methylase UbiE